MEIRKLKPTTDWIEFKLVGAGVVRLKLRMVDGFGVWDMAAEGERRVSALYLSQANAAIADWDLTLPDGKPLPCDDQTKAEYAVEIRAMLAKLIESKEGEPAEFLATKIVEMARDSNNFLGN